MRRLLLILLALFLCQASLACKRSKPLSHAYQNVSQGYENCKPADPNCTFFKLDYPVFSNGSNPEALKAINDRIQAFLLTPTGEKKAKDVEEFAKNFFSEFGDFHREFPSAPQVWTLERSVKILVENQRLLSLALDESQYLGGAHPNSSERLLSLNPATGTGYSLSDFFVPGYADKLSALGEKAFRKAREIPEEQSLEEAGFEFKNGAFQLNDNYAAGARGLVFYYNPYEIGAYVMGPTEVVIEYADMKDLLKPDGPLSGLDD